MAKRLWDKGGEIKSAIHEFTVGNDPELDGELVRFDILGSAAHVRMLAAIKVITSEELELLLKGLGEIRLRDEEGKFEIPFELEDCHTAIENYLTESLGDVGKKIHTGRSRNDQVLTAMRLYLRDQSLTLLEECAKTSQTLLHRYNDLKSVPLPGYTHFQLAMPSSVGMWLEAFAESFLDLIRSGFQVLDALDSSPLGAASGFGTTIPVDRAMTSKLMGFKRVQRNPVAVQSSRGQIELKVLRWCVDIASVVEKCSSDLMLYTTREFGFFSLPDSLTTGSSIMPQKHNPDVVELMRARASKIRAAQNELEWVIAKLPSHYHRDFQYTKEPVMRGIAHILELLPIYREVVESLQANVERISEAMAPELYATYDAERQVKSGVPFRDAYRETAKKVKQGSLDLSNLQQDFSDIAKCVDADCEEAWSELAKYEKRMKAELERISEIEDSLLP